MEEVFRNVRNNREDVGNLVFSLPAEEKNLARRLEKLLYKLNAAEAAVKYNRICLQEGLLPNYTRIRLHDPNAADEEDTRAFRRRLATRQIKEKTERVREIKQEIHLTRTEWRNIQQEDRSHVHQTLMNLATEDYNERERTIIRKLGNLIEVN